MTTTSKHAEFFLLLEKMGLPQKDRRDYIFDYTEGLTGSLSELYTKWPPLYREMLADMEKEAQKAESEMDIWRKRVMASIGGWLKLSRQTSNLQIIKAIACNSTGYDDFNKIPKQRLINIYNTFLDKQRDIKSVNKEVQQQLAYSALAN